MAGLKEGDQFPPDVVFSYIPYTPESADITSCGIPQNYNASKEWADKKVVLFAVPGAFTPGCSVRHLPGYIDALQDIKGKKVDIVAVLAYNDAFVMSAWGKANGIKDEIVSPHLFSIYLDWNLSRKRMGQSPCLRMRQEERQGYRHEPTTACDDFLRCPKITFTNRFRVQAIPLRPGNQILEIHRLDPW
ncbi:uncharacterized protein Z520_09389 [Fonsecaea multimorphosa CBS 102226]|uniref:Redoxin domain-containing protein n=1 Tax=Fonsecaea multimorphosa CBS 102226 TaxID=1442371 RepID=A0A0D2JX37_9EURO|nr:uncharacterized protein Z520_09389 [Fonsecaea multimorphosa CBS 102226]KIX95079.1 hypothetical protein Z520_09389 [Fonsecaea multimorphosa CBS 102226]